MGLTFQGWRLGRRKPASGHSRKTPFGKLQQCGKSTGKKLSELLSRLVLFLLEPLRSPDFRQPKLDSYHHDPIPCEYVSKLDKSLEPCLIPVETNMSNMPIMRVAACLTYPVTKCIWSAVTILLVLASASSDSGHCDVVRT